MHACVTADMLRKSTIIKTNLTNVINSKQYMKSCRGVDIVTVTTSYYNITAAYISTEHCMHMYNLRIIKTSVVTAVSRTYIGTIL